jgi:hypothetical protein
MKKKYTQAEIQVMLEKVFLDGKINSTKFHLNYIESLLQKNKEWQEYFERKGIYGNSEEWFECHGQFQILTEIKNQFEECIKIGMQKSNSI